MNKILLGILITGIFSACSNSELKATVFTQGEEYKLLENETEELKIQIEELKIRTEKLMKFTDE
ncbi:hypothetical protein [Psychrilyobacter atlanticus]|uniref:hypothetical protein n=1 Tax=Psychrilyobacter atlanticus TaxID=271091 RepID=UPI00040D0CA5|nr:hypothetical protein [Psychrilyobacter atlanticus]